MSDWVEILLLYLFILTSISLQLLLLALTVLKVASLGPVPHHGMPVLVPPIPNPAVLRLLLFLSLRLGKVGDSGAQAAVVRIVWDTGSNVKLTGSFQNKGMKYTSLACAVYQLLLRHTLSMVVMNVNEKKCSPCFFSFFFPALLRASNCCLVRDILHSAFPFLLCYMMLYSVCSYLLYFVFFLDALLPLQTMVRIRD